MTTGRMPISTPRPEKEERPDPRHQEPADQVHPADVVGEPAEEIV